MLKERCDHSLIRLINNSLSLSLLEKEKSCKKEERGKREKEKKGGKKKNEGRKFNEIIYRRRKSW